MNCELTDKDQMNIWAMLPLNKEQRAQVLAEISKENMGSAVFSNPQSPDIPAEVVIADVDRQVIIQESESKAEDVPGIC